MKPLLFVFQLFIVAPVILGQPFGLNLADLSAADGWAAGSAAPGLGYLMVLGWIGIGMTIVGCKLFDQCMPADADGESSKPDPGSGG